MYGEAWDIYILSSLRKGKKAMIPSKNIEISDLKWKRIYLTFAISGQQSNPFMLSLIKRALQNINIM